LNLYLVLVFVVRLFLPEWIAYIIGTVLLIAVIFFSYKELDKRIAIGKTIKSVIFKSKKDDL
jgi:ABC-type xylose transport system permease subunit